MGAKSGGLGYNTNKHPRIPMRLRAGARCLLLREADAARLAAQPRLEGRGKGMHAGAVDGIGLAAEIPGVCTRWRAYCKDPVLD